MVRPLRGNLHMAINIMIMSVITQGASLLAGDWRMMVWCLCTPHFHWTHVEKKDEVEAVSLLRLAILDLVLKYLSNISFYCFFLHLLNYPICSPSLCSFKNFINVAVAALVTYGWGSWSYKNLISFHALLNRFSVSTSPPSGINIGMYYVVPALLILELFTTQTNNAIKYLSTTFPNTTFASKLTVGKQLLDRIGEKILSSKTYGGFVTSVGCWVVTAKAFAVQFSYLVDALPLW